ncbi:unnamed protein product [Caenorhabditis angaria]|uniref:Major facilitator superfamily (MFS) profile domain-containing protein n=1 Tax=Caenorhabditis angaria TaxID=860376 RepID=A0A9P1IKT1_9PELO|nr:unnamed protein product [Caenorhabditis angaria]
MSDSNSQGVVIGKMKFDDFLFKNLGEIGKFQIIQLIFVCIPMVLVSSDGLSWTFASLETPFRCKVPEEGNNKIYKNEYLNFTKCYDRKTEERKNIEDWNKEGITCEYSEKCWLDGEKCEEYVFDHSYISYTATEKWGIVCDHKWIKALIQAVYYIGQLIGSYLFGIIGDKFGRKVALYIALTLQIPFCFLIVFSPWWIVYGIGRFMIGFSHAGVYLLANVAGLETFGPKYRRMAGVAIGMFSAIGQIALGVIAIFVTNYAHLHLILAIPTLIFISYWWLVPESLRWLVSKQYYEKADKVLRKAAKINGKEIPDEWWDDLDKSNSEEKCENLTTADLFRTKEVRKRTLVLFFVWPTISMVYYGISMKADVLGGDIYMNFIISSAIEVPAILLVALLSDRLGRRLLVAGNLFISGIALMLNLIIDKNVGFVIAVIQMAIAKGSITTAFATLLIYSPELYPTIIRNTATGLSATIARTGAILASFISMWIVERYGKIYMIIPFGTCAIIASILTFVFLPETMGKPLADTMADIENNQEYEKLSNSEETEPSSVSSK